MDRPHEVLVVFQDFMNVKESPLSDPVPIAIGMGRNSTQHAAIAAEDFQIGFLCR